MDSWRFRRWLALMRSKVLRQSLPASKIFVLQLRRLERELRRPDDMLRLEHERHRVRNLLRLRCVRSRCALEGLGVGPVPAHAVVQARARREESFPLLVVWGVASTHEIG